MTTTFIMIKNGNSQSGGGMLSLIPFIKYCRVVTLTAINMKNAGYQIQRHGGNPFSLQEKRGVFESQNLKAITDMRLRMAKTHEQTQAFATSSL
mmetsp:Transcript_33674/g.49286  ORF Transcript_33674/g.49286 Transcript_33674/m.49286 type:complete len:94 (-) Transcript_33674:705-986(-)